MKTINGRLNRLKEDTRVLEREIDQHGDDMPYLLTKMRDLLTKTQNLLTEIEVSEMEDDLEDDEVNVYMRDYDLDITAAQFKKAQDRVAQNLNEDNSDFHMVDGEEVDDIFNCKRESDLWWFFETFNGDPRRMWKKYVGELSKRGRNC